MTKQIFNKLRASAGDTSKSIQWYQAQVAKLGKISPSDLLKEGKQVTTIFPGEMYMFRYDPKLKESLSYYDTFPLTLPFRRVPGGFLGINFHYMPYLLRMKMLRLVSEFAEDPKVDDDTFVRLRWKVIESSTRMAPLTHCVKHYLLDQVQTRFLKIPFPDWVIASQLPVERFEGAHKTDVWRDLRKKLV